MDSPSRTRLARGTLDSDVIIDAAFEVAEEVGLDNLSLALLAARLGVGVTSVLWHLKSRDEVLRRMAARAVATLEGLLPKPNGRDPQHWQQFLKEYFSRQRAVFAQDDLLTDLTAMRSAKYGPRADESGFLSIEEILKYLVSAGFSPLDAWNTYCWFSMYTQGFVVVERRSRANGVPERGTSQLKLLDVESVPIIAQLLQADEVSIDLAGQATFEAGLDRLLAGTAGLACPGPAQSP